MNTLLQRLFEAGKKRTKKIIGLMSGTSLDGLDIALCHITGHGKATQVTVEAFVTRSYSQEMTEKLQKVVSVKKVSLQQLCLVHTWLGNYHGKLVLEALDKWGMARDDIDGIASHGQSVFHAPKRFHQQEGMPNSTLQIGDGDHIARKTGIITISDFRQKHTAAGGEGAPLAALVDEMLFTANHEARLLLNIGGIANFTYLPRVNDAATKTITTDTGPGNTLIDRAMQLYFDQPYDKDGLVAAQGTVHPQLLKQLLHHPFFTESMPRTTGPELFNMEWVQQQQDISETTDIQGKDLIATLTQFSGQTIATAIKQVIDGKQSGIYLSGGGMHNPQLVACLEEELGRSTSSFEAIGFNPDAKEAACFAVLANELLSGEGFLLAAEGMSNRRLQLGKISFP